jgi:hypothetical protein
MFLLRQRDEAHFTDLRKRADDRISAVLPVAGR